MREESTHNSLYFQGLRSLASRAVGTFNVPVPVAYAKTFVEPRSVGAIVPAASACSRKSRRLKLVISKSSSALAEPWRPRTCPSVGHR